jgi:hypothetical protein
MDQSERLKSLITELLESPHSFAVGIGLPSAATIYAVINNGRPISQKLLKRIIDTYPNLNPDWIINGTLPKLLTGKMELNKNEILNEGTEYYNSKCHECREKDKEIEKLKSEIIDLQKQIIDKLKEASG